MPEAKYPEIAEDMARRVRANEWERELPGLNALAEEYRVTRSLMERVFGILEDRQLIVRHRGKNARPRAVFQNEGKTDG